MDEGDPGKSRRSVLNGILWVVTDWCTMGGPARPVSIVSDLS